MRSIALLLSLLAITFAAAPAAALAAASEPMVLFIGEDASGNVVMEVVPASAVDHNASCGGIAPLDPATCSTGPHTYAGDGSLRHGFTTCSLSPFYAFFVVCGTFSVTSVVSDGVRTRTFTCHGVPGVMPLDFAFLIIQCAGTGPFPTTDFTHDCSIGAFRGVVPAAGWWDCVAWHN